MTERAHRETARIYQFPIRERARESQKTAGDIASARLPSTECGSGWYHEAAMQEAEQARRRQPR